MKAAFFKIPAIISGEFGLAVLFSLRPQGVFTQPRRITVGSRIEHGSFAMLKGG